MIAKLFSVFVTTIGINTVALIDTALNAAFRQATVGFASVQFPELAINIVKWVIIYVTVLTIIEYAQETKKKF